MILMNQNATLYNNNEQHNKEILSKQTVFFI